MDYKIIFLMLTAMLFLTSGCEDAAEDIKDTIQTQVKAELLGSLMFCPEERPYRTSFFGDCVDEYGLKKYIDSLKETITKCEYESDCPYTCFENKRWKQGCNPRTNLCERTFDYECGSDTIAGIEFSKICQNGECKEDAPLILAKKNELSQQVKDLIAKKQTAQARKNEAYNACLNGLSDVTNKFIIESASKFTPAGLLDVASDATMGLVDELTSNPEELTPEEFIAINCKLSQSLEGDFKLFDLKIEKLQDQYRELDAVVG
ncbi:MAG: hypothetical protein WC471_01975 [Candidatus Woesearchaeota archaeon]